MISISRTLSGWTHGKQKQTTCNLVREESINVITENYNSYWDKCHQKKMCLEYHRSPYWGLTISRQTRKVCHKEIICKDWIRPKEEGKSILVRGKASPQMSRRVGWESETCIGCEPRTRARRWRVRWGWPCRWWVSS